MTSPLPLRFYVVLTVGQSLVAAAIQGSVGRLLTVPIAVLVAYFLLKGVRWLWIASIVLTAPSVVLLIISGAVWWEALFSVVTLALLISPPSWRYFDRKEPHDASSDTGGIKAGRGAEQTDARWP